MEKQRRKSAGSALLFVLATPAVSWLVLYGLQAYYTAQFFALLAVPLPSTAQSMRVVCRYGSVQPDHWPDVLASLARFVMVHDMLLPDFKWSDALAPLCAYYTAATLMEYVALGTGALGLGLLGLITLAGALARTDRQRLYTFFRPGLYLTVGLAIVLMLLHTALIFALVVGWVSHVEHVLLYVVVAAPTSCFALACAALRTVRIPRWARVAVLGVDVLHRVQAPALCQYVHELARRLGAPLPDHIVAGLDPTFFVTEAQVHCLAPWEWLRGRTLYVSLPLCRILTYAELQAVISHELGHFQGSDTRFSQRFYPLYRGTEAALTALASTGSVLDTVVDLVKGWVVFFVLWGLVWWLWGNTVPWRFAVFLPLQGLAISPARSLLWFFYQIFARAERTVSRERELAADQGAVHVTGTRSLATALVKLSLFADVWDQLRHTLPPPRNLSALFAARVQATTRQRILDRCAVLSTEEREWAWTHPTDSHPPLAQRLQALGVSEAEAVALVLDLAPAEPAIQLISDYHRLEEVLTALVQGRITTDDLFAYIQSYSDIELRH